METTAPRSDTPANPPRRASFGARPDGTDRAGARLSRTDSHLRAASRLGGLVSLLALVAAAVGLMLPGFYRDPAAIVPAMRGQDLLTLLVLPALALAIARGVRGSARAVIVWLALLGYLLYTYTGAAFAYAFNELFPLYVALFSLSIVALLALVRAVDPAAVAARFAAGTPRRAVAAFLLLVAVMVALPEIAQIADFYATGIVPEIVRRAEGPTSFIYVLDLGVVLPLCLASALWLWRDRPSGYLLAGCMLVKGATMGLALMSMTWFSVLEGIALEVGLTIVYAAIAAGSLAVSWWFLRSCRS